MKQKTIEKSFHLSGKGLHGGKNTNLTFLPADENHGVKFQRTDIADRPIVEALVSNVNTTTRGTSICSNGYEIKTIEHLMAALFGCGINNVLIEIDSDEVPIMDGSSRCFVNEILKVGIREQEAEQPVYQLESVIRYEDKENNVELIAIPSDEFKISITVDYGTKVLGTMTAELSHIEEFETEIAPNRTFCFLHEILPLIKNNQIKGGDFENAVVYVEQDISEKDKQEIMAFFGKKNVQLTENGTLNNTSLHFCNEAARHKLLDLIGDLALVGMPVQAQIIAKCPGHTANTKLAKLIADKIKKDKEIPRFDLNKKPVYTIEDIKRMLPHRPPFLLIDRVLEVEAERIVGIKNVTMNESFFAGHFPDEPIMPGVLIMESMAQLGGILVLGQVPDPENYSTFFLKMNNVRWREKVVPGDTLVHEMVLLEPVRRGIVHMFGKAYVNNKLVAEGDLMALVAKTK
ncbi:MAG: bifunctional UDP-3-O-[3-hydroxymyristoyl] N-acetylglucosamine deacetylase/3-hydroxyacyl-ACP dehydratase [Lentimicrobiaceae bacterium]|nr:bifunctional UDP-3-O-[3-hydroxymyristoyl] N-acetylglucosamine deacetylase/3-hydroxyacyl-ACP dehydratase [Lentimicrobiaceae bacterium]